MNSDHLASKPGKEQKFYLPYLPDVGAFRDTVPYTLLWELDCEGERAAVFGPDNIPFKVKSQL